MSKDLPVRRGACSLVIVSFALVGGCPSSLPPNQSPTADAGDQQTVDGGEQVTLDGSGSSDPDGDSLTYEWSQIAGPTVSLTDTRTVQASFLSLNQDVTLRFALLVTDDSGASSTDVVNVVISTVDNVPPVASAGSSQTTSGGVVVVLDGSGSFDNDGDPLTYNWVQIDGTLVTLMDGDTASPGFTARNEDDELVFELTIDDGNEHTDTDTVTITVERVPLEFFVASLSGNSVLRFVDAASLDGNVEPDATLSDEEALLDAPIDVIMTGESQLIVLNRNSNWDVDHRAVPVEPSLELKPIQRHEVLVGLLSLARDRSHLLHQRIGCVDAP